MHPLTLAIVLALAAAPAVAAEPAPPAASDATTRALGDAPPSAGLPGATRADDGRAGDAPADANPASALTAAPPWSLGQVQVLGQRLFPYQEGMVLNERYIDDQARGNGDIGTLLRINPNVQFAENGAQSQKMGEIRPAEISINGGLFYQNAFRLDGANFNNDFDPGNRTTLAADIEDVPSFGQGIALDTSLIGSLVVYDSNVPAAFGGFNGGVVDVESRRARDRFAGRVAYRTTRSSWSEMIVAPENEACVQQSTGQGSTACVGQPRYDKEELRATVEGRFGNGLGLIANVTTLRSTIPLRGYSGGTVSPSDANTKEQTRQNTSYSLRADWSSGSNFDLGASLTYAPTDERYFLQNIRDSFFDLKQGGPVASLRANVVLGAWTLSNTLGYSDLDSSRRSEADSYRAWYSSEAFNWNPGNALAGQGSWGDVDQTTRNINYRFVAERAAAAWGASEHRLQLGAEVGQRDARYERLRDFANYRTQGRAATSNCIAADGVEDTVSCSLSPVTANVAGITGRGQYFTQRWLYQAGSFEARIREWALFAEDDIRLGRWSFRPGVRVDGDDLMDDVTVAPRFAMSWDAFGDRRTLLTAGANRYYGRTFFNHLLREGRESLRLAQVRGADLLWRDDTRNVTANRFQDLDVPYSDEATAGVNQAWAGFDWNLKYVHRRNRDEVLRRQVRSNDTSGTYAVNVYEYVNAGRSESDTLTLAVASRAPFVSGPTSTQVQLALDHTDVKRNYSTYETQFNEDTFSEIVRYEGRLVRREDLPADDFNRPWGARLAAQTRIESAGLLFSNFLRYRAGYLNRTVVGSEQLDGRSISVLEDLQFPGSWTWDATVEWTLPVHADVYVRAEVQNVLNRANRTAVSNYVAYEPGRSTWLEIGYRF